MSHMYLLHIHYKAPTAATIELVNFHTEVKEKYLSNQSLLHRISEKSHTVIWPEHFIQWITLINPKWCWLLPCSSTARFSQDFLLSFMKIRERFSSLCVTEGSLPIFLNIFIVSNAYLLYSRFCMQKYLNSAPTHVCIILTSMYTYSIF